MTYELTVNGRPVVVDAPAMTPLLDVLRDELDLRGAKRGCGEGRCGACTVRVGGRTVVSCLLPVALAAGEPVETVEGVAAPDAPLHPVQDALLECGGVQCGACTPGMVMSLCSLLEAHPDPDEQDVREALTGNICRCTGYQKIIDAALSAAGTLREARS
ncbi:(2Fe-2S)-binding protein [Pseudonocardia sp. C8]|uniref:(2Fe-2S)-binding protein n=1 Tax=Pseudonocardia sp. C8 TaxID=2762759 RepID=UPI0016431634|nr:(2Fe-2S)-binding protein [Pseudonocardia sp. C8]MBC3193357.1 (2Fe-2S)-binding protein [Pseudonocardia sp. C8]